MNNLVNYKAKLKWSSKITADGDCSHGIKRCLLLGRKTLTNLDSLLRSRDITLPTKVHLVKAMVFSLVMYGCESLTVKEAECQRIDAFELWCWRRLLRVPWTARRSDQSILKEISPEYSLEGLMLKLKLQYFGYLMWRTDSLEKTLMLTKIEGRSRRWQNEMVGWHHQLNGHEFEQALGVGDGQGSLACCSPWGHKELDTTKKLNWTEGEMEKRVYMKEMVLCCLDSYKTTKSPALQLLDSPASQKATVTAVLVLGIEFR